MRIVVFVTALLFVSGVAGAVNPEFYRWQFGEFAATLRYLQYGEATDGINEIYAREIGGFVRAEDVRIATLCAGKTLGTLTGSWTFFGARFLPLVSEGGAPSFYGLSYLGGAVGFHNGSSYDAVISPSMIVESLDGRSCILGEKGLSDAHVAGNGYEHLTRGGHFAPLSWNSGDLDDDGHGDFTVGGMLYLSKSEYSFPVSTARKGAEAVFIRSDAGVRLVRIHEGVLSIERLDRGQLVDEKTLAIRDVVLNAGHALSALPGANGDTIALRTRCGLSTYHYENGMIAEGPCMSGLVGDWALPGARGDFNADGWDDFWLTQTTPGMPVEGKTDHVRLISGAALASASGVVEIDALTIARVNGSASYTDYDGIATTLSPLAGDIDGDGLPDVSFSGHRHMNEAGALYVLLGKDVVFGEALSLEDPRVIKLAGPLMSQLAPPYHHWDATDWDRDGNDDIVVTADNDMCSGLNAGAVYVLSGAAILESYRARAQIFADSASRNVSRTSSPPRSGGRWTPKSMGPSGRFRESY